MVSKRRSRRVYVDCSFSALRTCFELKSTGISVSGRYYLDPDGNGLDSEPPIQVYCDMASGMSKSYLEATIVRRVFT